MLRDEIKLKLNECLKNKDKKSVSTLRLVLAAVKDRDIAARSNGNNSGISDDEVKLLLQTMIKQRKGSIELYVQGKRDDLAKKEENEIKIISNFLPSQLSKQEIDEIINKTIKSSEFNSMKDIGKVIKIIKEQYDGMMDFGYVSKVVKEKLSNL